jgi:Tfp pilus assembly protein FimT
MIAAGFTLIELLIIMAIVTLIGLTSVPFLSRFYLQNAVQTTYDQLGAELRKAQTYALEGKQNGPWGVHLGGGSMILFQGNAFAGHTNTAYDETFNKNPNVTINGYPGTGDIIFTQMTGTTSATTTITMNAGNTTKTITVSALGIVSK